jgi:uncharacterized protein YecE (DUF72 family)
LVTGTVVIRIGTSGWSYDHWHPELYPPGLPARDRLARYAAAFGTAELNSSFYRWPRPAAFGSWRDRLPEGFRLSVKAPRGLTHARKLYAPEAWLQRIAAGWHELGGKRAVLLVQLPLRCRVMTPGWRISSGWSRAGCGWRWSSGTVAGIARRSSRCCKRTGPRIAW